MGRGLPSSDLTVVTIAIVKLSSCLRLGKKGKGLAGTQYQVRELDIT